MQFLNNGADIPDQLIRAVNERRAVFLCGAGVSKQVGMPLFKKLTERIYGELGARWEDVPAEKKAFEGGEYDRALRSLEKWTHYPGGPQHIRDATTRLLKAPPEINISHHRDLLYLSRDHQDRPRLLTTNFDTLFERAAKEAGGLSPVPSHTGKAIPKPGGVEDYGIMHLHGRIIDEDLQLPQTHLVLTSADFGDAYLRDGWASRYIEDRLRLHTVVLVGYQAEDAAMRLLLDTLDADRGRFPDLKDIFAINKQTTDSASIWQSKGITPIECADYSSIYNTLAEWARYARQPNAYARIRIRRTFLDKANVQAKSQSKKKTPNDVSEFERQQLRFSLARGHLTTTLAEMNPSIAWLPWLDEQKFLQRNTDVAAWIEQNLNDVNEIRNVADNIHLLNAETAQSLESNLNRLGNSLPPLLVKCWRLMIKHMRFWDYQQLSSEWLNIQSRIGTDDWSPEVISRFCEALKPKPMVSKLVRWREGMVDEPQRLADLINIEFKVHNLVNTKKILSLLPTDIPPDVREQLLQALTHTLETALDEAVDNEVEHNQGFSVSDRDIPCITTCAHGFGQPGFQPIVSVITAIWKPLAAKDSSDALEIVDQWRKSKHRLLRRLALYAAANPVVPAETVAEILQKLPQGELFISNSTIEVYELLRQRWNDLGPEQRRAIEARLRERPPADCLREGMEADSSISSERIQRCQFDLLGNLQRDGLDLGNESTQLLKEIQARWPAWQLRLSREYGLRVLLGGYVQSVRPIDCGELENQTDDELVATAETEGMGVIFREEETGPTVTESPDWEACCRHKPQRALQALVSQAQRKLWSTPAWDKFLWMAKVNDNESAQRIMQLLLDTPDDSLMRLIPSASWWLSREVERLPDEGLWKLWDRLVDSVSNDVEEVENDGDLYTKSINAPSGQLAEILLGRWKTPEVGREIPEKIQIRLEKLIGTNGRFGTLARVNIAAEVTRLFEYAPNWTSENILPLFNWSSPDARAVWSAQKYSNYIGSPTFFAKMKEPFLALFARADLGEEDLQCFSAWLVMMMLANQSPNVAYPITLREARVALRQLGERGMRTVVQRLANKMQDAKPEDKESTWDEVVGPVFKGMWPLDTELQTPAATNALVRMLLASGAAFPRAAKDVIPFIRPENPGEGCSIFIMSISSAYSKELNISSKELDNLSHEELNNLFSGYPQIMLDLVAAIVGDQQQPGPYRLAEVLRRVRRHDPQLANTRTFQRLWAITGD